MLKQLGVKTQLLALSVISLVLFLAALLVAVFAMQASQVKFQTFIDRDTVRLAAFNEMYAQGLQSGQALRNIMLDPQNRKAYDNLDKALADFKAAFDKARELSAGNAQLAPLLDRVDQLARQQTEARSAVLADVAAGSFEGAKARLNKEETPAWRALKKELLDSIVVLARDAEDTKLKLAEECADKQRQIILITVVAVLAMLAISRMIGHNLLQQLGGEPARVIMVAERIAKGDLTESLPASHADQDSLMATFIRMQAALKAMVGATQQSAREMTGAVADLKIAAEHAAAASAAQSEAASGMAASVEETSVSIDQVRDSAGEARGLAAQAGSASAEGGRVINTAADEMGEVATAVNGAASTIRDLENYSTEISTIINVIREVADQTNLLALNAAIEAARAGEQGRGFAVVADEVRKLAERTSESTHTIAGVIEKVQASARQAAHEMESGVSRVQGGVDLARRAGDSIAGIQAGTQSVSAAVSDIGNALNEQAIAVQEIARGVERIANMAEENSASAQQTTVAADRLNALADALERSVAQFRV